MSSRLIYHGTRDDVREGDRVEYASWLLRRKRPGTVVCIPKKTALQLDAEKKMPQDWLIRFDDGTVTGWMYHPEELQPNARLRLLSRGNNEAPMSNEDLEREDAEIAKQSSLVGDLLGCLIVLIVVVAVLTAVILGIRGLFL